MRVPGADRYDSRTDSHYHIICMRCGTVEDVPSDYREDIDLTIAGMTGYVHLRHRVVFEGLCNKCLKAEAEQGRSRRLRFEGLLAWQTGSFHPKYQYECSPLKYVFAPFGICMIALYVLM